MLLQLGSHPGGLSLLGPDKVCGELSLEPPVMTRWLTVSACADGRRALTAVPLWVLEETLQLGSKISSGLDVHGSVEGSTCKQRAGGVTLAFLHLAVVQRLCGGGKALWKHIYCNVPFESVTSGKRWPCGNRAKIDMIAGLSFGSGTTGSTR
jgi:hypothetical protein